VKSSLGLGCAVEEVVPDAQPDTQHSEQSFEAQSFDAQPDAEGFCASAAARSKEKQQARLARRAAEAPVVGGRVEVIAAFLPVRHARWVPIGVRGVVVEVGDAAQPDGLQVGEVAVVWDVPRLASVRGGGIGAAIVSPHDWRCCRQLSEGDG